ncbi:MAG: MFS transporter [Alphaproteobacteria bacterium]|nr:MFS transporter [Alphaproteobacteria bacterium]MBV9692319.1 MFS transporter [Alphaproteobacteria bacterium]
MSATGRAVRPAGRTRAAVLSYLQPRSATILVLGASCGLPLLTITNVLTLWLTDSKVSIAAIGLFAYTLLPYSFKFVWAPLLDQVRLPYLHRVLGKRRAWMVIAQLGIAVAFAGLCLSDPHTHLFHVAMFALLLGFCGASQDISVDAWRIEIAPVEEQGTMLGAYQLGYGLTRLATAALAPAIAELISWRASLIFLGCMIVLGLGASLLARRPPESDARGEVRAAEQKLHFFGAIGAAIGWFYGAVIAPFVDFFRSHGWVGLLILAMIGLYRLPDFVMGTVARPMYRQSFSLLEIGTMAGLIGVWVTIAGSLIGGFFVFRFGIARSLFLGLIAVIAGNLMYALLAASGHNIAIFGLAIGIENLAGGFAGTALLAYMSSLTNKSFTATQYALFSSFYALPGKLLGGTSGYLVAWFAHQRHSFDSWLPGLGALPDKVVGFVPFFVTTALTGLPALVLLILVLRRDRPKAA